jgi:hypothetical protein
VELDQIQDSHGALSAQLTIVNSLDPSIIYESGQLNLSAMQTRTTLGNNLKRDFDFGIDWTAMLRQVCLIGTRIYRTGAPRVALHEHQLGDTPRWYLEPYMEREGFAIMYADGGTGKSMAAIAMAYTIASGYPLLGRLKGPAGPALYYDWETGPDTQYRRLRALAASAGQGSKLPQLYYRAMTNDIVSAAPQIRADIAETGATAVFVDSLGAAGPGPIEESAVALAVGRAMLSFRRPTMAVHHKPKDTNGKRGAQAMFGSVYFANYCRLAWELTGTFDEGSCRTDLQFVNTKCSNGPHIPMHAVSFTFTNDADSNPISIAVRGCEIRDVPEFSKNRPIWQQAVDILTHGPHTVADLAEELEVSAGSMRKVLSRELQKGRVLKVAGERWGLVASARDTNDNDIPF